MPLDESRPTVQGFHGMAPKTYRHFRDTKRARLLREYAKKVLGPGADGPLSIESLYIKEGNVFKQFGFTHPELELLKALLVAQIYRIITGRENLTQKQAAEILGITQQEVSSLKRRNLSNFSVGRLIEFAVILGQDVELVLQPAKEARGQVSLTRQNFSE
jgi:predicted XRE-type DNA-binding protein